MSDLTNNLTNLNRTTIIRSLTAELLILKPVGDKFEITLPDGSVTFKTLSEVQEAFTSKEWSTANVVRSNADIAEVIVALEKDIVTIRQRLKRNQYHDVQAAYGMISENQCRIHTLQWVLGQHDRWD